MNLMINEKDFLKGIFNITLDGVKIGCNDVKEDDVKLSISIAEQFFNIYQSFKMGDYGLVKSIFLLKAYSKVTTFDEFVNHVYSGNFVTGLTDLDYSLIRQIHKLAYKDGSLC